MSKRVSTGIAAIALAMSVMAGSAASAADLPDWSGVWQIPWQTIGGPENSIVLDPASTTPYGCYAFDPPCRVNPPYNAAYEAKYKALNAKFDTDTLPDPLTQCTPRTTPGNMLSPDLMEFIVRPERVWMFIENSSQARHVYTDGREHRTGADAFNTFTGDSIGHWEGDTLVVDTVHIVGDMIIDRSGTILSDQAHVVERIRRLDADTMQFEFTITDPGALTAPWKITRRYKRAQGELLDYACGENNRNPISAEGQTLAVGPDGKPIEKLPQGAPDAK